MTRMGVLVLALSTALGVAGAQTDAVRRTGLIRAADRGHVEIVRELLKTDTRVNHVNRLG